MSAPAPGPDGRTNLAAAVQVHAHHSGVHDGINIEVDAPAGTRITLNVNDGQVADLVVPQ